MTLADGDAFVVGDIFSFQQAERIKDNWRAAAAPSNPQPGSLWSDSVNELLKHRQAASWKEILQADTPLSDNLKIIIGTDSDAIIKYDEATNDALILAIPSVAKRGLIVCDIADIDADFTSICNVVNDTRINIVDFDIDSRLCVGFGLDDLPGMWSVHHDLHLQFSADHDLKIFTNAETGENPYVYIYGYDTGAAAVKFMRFWIGAAGGGNIDVESDKFGALRENNIIIMQWNSSLMRIPDDKIITFGTDDDMCMGHLSASDIWHLCDQATLGSNIRMSINATGLSFFGVAPVAKAAHIPDSSGDDAAAVNAILLALENLGLVATS